MPAVLIGVGGVGGSIVADVRQQLDARVNAAGQTPAAVEQANQFRFFLIDTKEESFSLTFQPAERFVVPSGIDKFHVDQKVSSWYNSVDRGDRFFREWWPEQNGYPYRVGDFDEGAGQIRIKGKLAYRMHVGDSDDNIADAVESAVKSIRSALGISPSQDLHKIPVYIICSLGGGTGSGISLALAQHLRQVLPSYCVVIGVFLLASIAEMAPGKADEASIWANTDAALREIDYFQRPLDSRVTQPRPFLDWPGSGNRIDGREAPFSYVYLFTRENRSNLTLNSVHDYIRLVAECLAAETFNDLHELIKGPHSQFVARFVETPDVDGRATSYASAGLASVRYPTDRITQHLNRRYGAHVLRRAFTAKEDKAGQEAAEQFLRERALLWDDAPSLRESYILPLKDGNELVAFPRLDDAKYTAADRNQIGSLVQDRRAKFETWRDQSLAPFVQKQTREKLAELTGHDGALRAFMYNQLRGTATGIPRTLAAIDELIKVITRQSNDLRAILIGDETGVSANSGLRDSVDSRRDALSGQITKLPQLFGTLRDRKGVKAKQGFLKKRWKPFVEDEQKLVIVNQALALYGELLREVEIIQTYLGELVDASRRLALVLDDEASDDLGINVKGGVLDVGILDDPDVVDHHFKSQMERVVEESWGSLVLDLVTREHGVIDALGRKLDRSGTARHESIHDDLRDAFRDSITTAGTTHFEHSVQQLNIWDAIKIECDVRQQLNLADTALEEASLALEERRIVMNRLGTPLVNGSGFLLQQFVQRKLLQCKRRAMPFWSLDNVVQSDFADQPGLLYPLTVLAYDKRTYDDFIARERLDPGMIHSIADDIGVAPQHMEGPDSIVLYCREGVAPLFFLNRNERAHLRESASRIAGRNKEIHTDRRFRHVVDPFIAPPERVEDQRKYGVAVGTALGMLNVNGLPDRFTLSLPNYDPVGFKSVDDLLDHRADNPVTETELFRAINAWLARRDDLDKAELLGDAIRKAEKIRDECTDRERRWWQQTLNLLHRRLNDANYHVNR